MTTATTLRRGDLVRHKRRPEWGSGRVLQTQAITHEGKPAQRVTVDFKNHRTLTLNTAIAPLEVEQAGEVEYRTSPRNTPSHHSSASNARPTETEEHRQSIGWLDDLERSTGGKKHELHELPHSLSDPFLSDRQRLAHTLDTFYFSTDPSRLLDWARMQTGLDDPLTRYTRQELEQAFPRFARDRDQHLHQLVRQFKRNNDTQGLRSIADRSRNPRAARSALDKALNA